MRFGFFSIDSSAEDRKMNMVERYSTWPARLHVDERVARVCFRAQFVRVFRIRHRFDRGTAGNATMGRSFMHFYFRHMEQTIQPRYRIIRFRQSASVHPGRHTIFLSNMSIPKRIAFSMHCFHTLGIPRWSADISQGSRAFLPELMQHRTFE